jgi:hypothetical protein
MSTTVYDSQQEVFYEAARPVVYYGWYVSTSTNQLAVYPFASASERARFIQAVKSLMPDRADLYPEDIAAFVAVERWGDSLEDQEQARDLLAGRLEEEEIEKLDDFEWDLEGHDQNVQPPKGLDQFLEELMAHWRKALRSCDAELLAYLSAQEEGPRLTTLATEVLAERQARAADARGQHADRPGLVERLLPSGSSNRDEGPTR